MSLPFQGDDWLPGFNFNVEEWDAEGLHYETLAICRSLALARTVLAAAIAEKPGLLKPTSQNGKSSVA
jgi:hypothetical protein